MKQVKEYSVKLYCCMAKDCDKEYSTKFNLKRHVEIYHMKQKKYQCEYCQRFFVSQQNLKEHIFTHTGAKPYPCPVCGEFFRQISQLSLHRRDHDFKGMIIDYDQTSSKTNDVKQSLTDIVIQKIKDFSDV